MKRTLCLILCLFCLSLTACAAELDREAVLRVQTPIEQETALPETAITAPQPETESQPETPAPVAYCIEGVTALNQYPQFPTGCEATAAVTALQYWGVEMSIGDFVDFHLPIGEPFRMVGGRLYGPDPYESFVGNPRDATSFGCMAPAIATALEHAVGNEMEILTLSGSDLDTICRDYIANDIPVLLWVTMNMTDTGEGVSWYLSSGELYTWQNNEHCMVLIGYDENHYTLLDPMKGSAVTYPKDLVALRYGQLGMQAVALWKETK